MQPLTHSHLFYFSCRIKRRSSGDNNLDTKSGVAGSSGLVTSVQAQVAPPSACNVVLSPPPEVIPTIQTTAAVSSTTVGVGSVSGMVATSSANLTTVVHRPHIAPKPSLEKRDSFEGHEEAVRTIVEAVQESRKKN